jgi:hypothetical protein
MPLRNTLIDGELVLDVDPRTKQVRLSLIPEGFVINVMSGNVAIIDL